MNAVDIILTIVIAIALCGAVWLTVYRKKSGKGCCGNCSECGGCCAAGEKVKNGDKIHTRTN